MGKNDYGKLLELVRVCRCKQCDGAGTINIIKNDLCDRAICVDCKGTGMHDAIAYELRMTREQKP